MKKREPISHIMTTQVETLNLSDSLQQAQSTLEDKNIRHLPVVEGNKLVGMVSKTDIMRISFGSNFGDQEQEVDTAIFDMLSINQVMKGNPDTVSSDTPIKEVAEMLAQKEYHALPVADDGTLVGIVTTTDLIKYLLEQY